MSNSTEAIDAVLAAAEPGAPSENLSLEALILLINTERLNKLKDTTRNELAELKKRQEQVRTLHKLLKSINAATDASGKLDCSSSQEIKDLLTKAKEMGVEVKNDKFVYTKEERDRLVENLRISVEDFNVENEMQMQTVSRLTNERHETYQMARSILKPLHEAKLRNAQAIKG